MGIKIKTPKLLENGSISEINDKMLGVNHSFVFLGKEEELLNRDSSSYVEAFDMYVNGLYKVYHEFGMEFLKCYCNEAIRHNKNDTFSKHIIFIENCRGALSHSGDDGTRSYAFNTLKNYVFRNSKFLFNDWDDFWKHANEKQWKEAIEKIVRDSDRLYFNLLEKVAVHDINHKDVYEAVMMDFKINTYKRCKISNGTVTPLNCVDMYDVSLNGRFFKIIKQQLQNCGSFQSSEAEIANYELTDLINLNKYVDNRTDEEKNAGKKTPFEIKKAIIDAIKGDLEGGNNFDFKSDSLYVDVVTEVEKQIKKQISASRIAEYSSIIM